MPDNFFKDVTMMGVLSQGTAFVFMIFVMIMLYKYTPKFFETWRAFIEVLQGMRDDLKHNRDCCTLIQGEYSKDLNAFESRQDNKFSELHELAVKNLQVSEETNSIIKVKFRQV